jgi:hypothetical protein
MAFKLYLLASLFASVALSQKVRTFDPFTSFDVPLNSRASTTPVPILRFVDTQNADGSYTYGYENGDKTYKIETRYATGEVKGKYGYVDSNGELREVEYGATPTGGFEPRADGLVASPADVVADVRSAPAPATVQRRPESADGRKVVVVRRKQQPAQPVQAAAAAFVPAPTAPVVDLTRFDGHPANDINLQTGSYTLKYGKK